MKKGFFSHSLKDTYNIAKIFANSLRGGEIILLKGDLGAGKTTFVSNLAKILGVKEPISSPTFTILKIYKGKKFTIKHFDTYRLENENEAEEFGIEEHLDTSKNELVFIEWPEKINGLLPAKYIKVEFDYLGDNERKISIGSEVDE